MSFIVFVLVFVVIMGFVDSRVRRPRKNKRTEGGR